MFQVVLWFLLGSLVLVCFAEFINKGLNDSTRSNLPKSCPSINHNEHNTQFIWKNRLHQLTNCSEKDQKPPTWYEIVELNRNFRHCNHSTHHVFYPEGKPFLFRMRRDITESGIASDWVYFTKKEMYESDKYDTLKQNAYFDLNNKANRSETFFDEFFDMNLERNGSQKLAIFRNAVTNKYGLIVNLMDGCRSAVRNGGCYHMHHSKIYKYNAGGGDNPVYDSVISLTAGASGTWHFHMELLVALANIPDESIIKKSHIHVTSRTSFVISWLTMLGIEPNRIIDTPVIVARELYVPEMGRCGAPFLSQLNWLNSRFVPTNDSSLSGPNQNHSSSRTTQSNSIVLIRRTRSRTVSNQGSVENTVRSFSSSLQWAFQMHSDDRLPSLAEQLQLFLHARIVVAPHGAGGLFINYLPPNACVVELISKSNTCLAYSRLAYVRRIHYVQCFMNADRGNHVNEAELNAALHACHQAVTGIV